jgi:steroid 5-alpha reductase family enzyme
VITTAHNFFLNAPLALASTIGWVLIAFTVGRIVKRHATIDVFWGSGFVMVFAESLAHAHLSSHHHLSSAQWVSFAVVAAWGLRLSGYLAWRQVGSAEDPRYVWIMKGARGKNETVYALYKIYLFQALLMWFISLPLQYIASSTAHLSSLLVGLGIAVSLVGLFFEATGDAQLRAFLANPANAGTTLNSGLWAYTRHPNYFGDAVVWWGIFIVALSTGGGVFTLLSPILMTWLLTSLSGKPMLEKKLTKTRAGYEHYVATVSGFVPRPPKKRS